MNEIWHCVWDFQFLDGTAKAATSLDMYMNFMAVSDGLQGQTAG